jgi:epoxyqueuosine reductase
MSKAAEIKEVARSIGFSAVGILDKDRFRSLPVGPVEDCVVLVAPESLLATAKSMIVLGFKIWDPVFNLMAVGSVGTGGQANHQLYSEVANGKAWELAHHLWSRGHEAIVTRGVCLKKAAVLAGIGAQGKNTVVVSPEHGTSLRFAGVLTTAALEEDSAFGEDLCGSCTKCVDACPTKALGPHGIELRRCMVYAAEDPRSPLVAGEVRAAEARLLKRPTKNSFVECTICLAACPIGRQALDSA